MRIAAVTLTDFRAFPGPTPARFDLEGKSLLLYGENGSGKSSLFHALGGIFSPFPEPALDLLKNSFSNASLGNLAVGIEFTDGTSEVWRMAVLGERATLHALQAGPFLVAEHPAWRPELPNQTIRQASTAVACLDYRSLLSTNYKHGGAEINLFELAVHGLMAGYRDLATSKTIAELWKALLDSKPLRNAARPLAACLKSCDEFNNAMQRALTALETEVKLLLPTLAAEGVVLRRFVFDPVTYNFAKRWEDKGFNNQRIGIDIVFRGHAVARPQLYLNEARQSALGLSIFLGSRLASVPASSTSLKLLVLDDVLIGLDHSNRLPVLDVLTSRFGGWQIVLLTHDKTWFDLARMHLPETDWTCYEVYEGDHAADAPMPIVRRTENRPAKAMLKKAEELLPLGYVEAAANYARQAFESALRAACELKKCKVSYRQDVKLHQAQDLIDQLKLWPGSVSVSGSDWKACVKRVETFKDIVMNPYSHPSAPNIPKQEVIDAIAELKVFMELIRKN